MANMIYGDGSPEQYLRLGTVARGTIYIEIARREIKLWIKSSSESWICFGPINALDPAQGDIGCWQVATPTWNDLDAQRAVANLQHQRGASPPHMPHPPTPQGCMVLLYHLIGESLSDPYLVAPDRRLRMPASPQQIHWGEVREYGENAGEWYSLGNVPITGTLGNLEAPRVPGVSAGTFVSEGPNILESPVGCSSIAWGSSVVVHDPDHNDTRLHVPQPGPQPVRIAGKKVRVIR